MPCEFEVKIVGKKGHFHWELDHAGRIVCYVTHEPLSEDANREIITTLAETIGISKSHVRLIHGVENHLKVIKITDHDIAMPDVLEALGLETFEEEA